MRIVIVDDTGLRASILQDGLNEAGFDDIHIVPPRGGFVARIERLAPDVVLPAPVVGSGEQAKLRFMGFFAATTRNPHTRRAYARGCGDFLHWCAERGVAALPQIAPLHVAAWIEELGRDVSVLTVKQRLAGVRHLFDWLVCTQIVPANPAVSVRGPAYKVRRGKTPVLAPDEARADRADGLQARWGIETDVSSDLTIGPDNRRLKLSAWSYAESPVHPRAG